MKSIRLVPLPVTTPHAWLPAALTIYRTAMNYPRNIEDIRSPIWLQHVHQLGWRGYAAYEITISAKSTLSTMIGVAYGYPGEPGQWWNQQLHRGLLQQGIPPHTINSDFMTYFELAELHVHPDHQGKNIGHQLLTALLHDCPYPLVLLSTPEVPYENSRAWKLYRRHNFTDVLRDFFFPGDPRPFAILGRSLPLSPSLHGENTTEQPFWQDS